MPLPMCVNIGMRKYTKYTKEQLEPIVKQSFSLAEVLRNLGLVMAGGNYNQIKIRIAKYNLDTSHFTGKSWNKGKSVKDYKDYKHNSKLKNKLIKERGNACQECKIELWLDKPIKLELHHIDGNRANNDPNNLILLCPNCHSYTDNYRGRKARLGGETGETQGS